MKGAQIVKDNRPAGEYELFRVLYLPEVEIPEGWEINYVGPIEDGQYYLTTGGNVAKASLEDEERKFTRLILKKKPVPEKPKTIVIRPKMDKDGNHIKARLKGGDWYRTSDSFNLDVVYITQWPIGTRGSSQEYWHYHRPESVDEVK